MPNPRMNHPLPSGEQPVLKDAAEEAVARLIAQTLIRELGVTQACRHLDATMPKPHSRTIALAAEKLELVRRLIGSP
jgi:hypothetical protein